MNIMHKNKIYTSKYSFHQRLCKNWAGYDGTILAGNCPGSFGEVLKKEEML